MVTSIVPIAFDETAPNEPPGNAARLGPATRSKRPRCEVRHGLTLLEILLALALTGVVMVIISMAIDLHLRTMDTRRTSVEEAEIARAVLRHIGADLRSAVLYQPIDLSGAAGLSVSGDIEAMAGELLGSGDGSSGGGLGSQGSGGLSLPEDFDAAALAGEPMSVNTVDIAGTVEPTSVPGLFGNQFEVQVDISRLPRVDEYSVLMAPASSGGVADVPSDVKTVSYFLRDATSTAALSNGSTSLDSGAEPGLYRRSMSRAATSWASANGGVDPSQGGGELLAPEVNYLEFAYFDGLEWYTEWDSEQMGGLPVAIEITIGVDTYGSAATPSEDVSKQIDAVMTDQAQFRYRMVVHLPAAQPALPAEEEAIDSEGMEAVGL